VSVRVEISSGAEPTVDAGRSIAVAREPYVLAATAVPDSTIDVSPATGTTPRIRWDNLAALTFIHLLASLALIPAFFSWTGLIVAVLGIYVFGTLGINLGLHRLLTHRSLSCPRWLERGLVILGVCCAQDSPTIWVAIHRRHHQFSDREADPHTPVGSPLWGYVGWLLVKQHALENDRLVDRYARDLMRDPFYLRLHRSDNWIKVVIASWLLFFATGTAAAVTCGDDLHDAAQFGASVMIWGGFVRTVAVLHITWLANTVDHLWGYRNYETPDNSRNNPFIAILSNGEGWHNNHHADPRSANHGHRPGEFDLTWWTIRGLIKLGLAHDVVLPALKTRPSVTAANAASSMG